MGSGSRPFPPRTETGPTAIPGCTPPHTRATLAIPLAVAQLAFRASCGGTHRFDTTSPMLQVPAVPAAHVMPQQNASVPGGMARDCDGGGTTSPVVMDDVSVAVP